MNFLVMQNIASFKPGPEEILPLFEFDLKGCWNNRFVVDAPEADGDRSFSKSFNLRNISEKKSCYKKASHFADDEANKKPSLIGCSYNNYIISMRN